MPHKLIPPGISAWTHSTKIHVSSLLTISTILSRAVYPPGETLKHPARGRLSPELGWLLRQSILETENTSHNRYQNKAFGLKPFTKFNADLQQIIKKRFWQEKILPHSSPKSSLQLNNIIGNTASQKTVLCLESRFCRELNNNTVVTCPKCNLQQESEFPQLDSIVVYTSF